MESIWPPEHGATISVDIAAMQVGDEERVAAASALFDAPLAPGPVKRFLANPTHHLLIAYFSGLPVGFVSGVELTHPDKGTEMFLYELAVDSGYRHHGIGTALVEAIAAVAREHDCYGMWVLLDDENAAAAATYRKAGGDVESQPLMFSWKFDR